MADFGDFSDLVETYDAAERGEERELDTFTWFGATIRLVEHVPPIVVARYAASFRKPEAEMFVAAYELLEKAIHPEDWPTFEQLANERDVKPGAVIEVIDKILEARAGRPTSEPADSSTGSSSTSPTSTPGSAPEVVPPLSREDKLAAELGVTIPPNRPELRKALRLVDVEEPLEAIG